MEEVVRILYLDIVHHISFPDIDPHSSLVASYHRASYVAATSSVIPSLDRTCIVVAVHDDAVVVDVVVVVVGLAVVAGVVEALVETIWH